eukprot:TRINITY_DN16822_c0_g1_i1.p1 TRINITY_DN16822_c0_g1~~TRINITY_DN16822_c0_g1_i1.p1  ORF type:complete len:225 (-),score=74.57 TRINITY_DN16822_c0_g1_i1:545-1219(-)
MVMSSTEGQVRRLQAERDQLEMQLQAAQQEVKAVREEMAAKATALQEAEAEWTEHRKYLENRVATTESGLREVLTTETLLREKLAKAHTDSAKQKEKHEKALLKLRESADARYEMLKTKFKEKLDSRRDSVPRKSVAPVADRAAGPLIKEEPLNIQEGGRRVPRRSSQSRMPLADRTNEAAGRRDSDSDLEANPTAAQAPSKGQASPQGVQWAIGDLTGSSSMP